MRGGEEGVTRGDGAGADDLQHGALQPHPALAVVADLAQARLQG